MAEGLKISGMTKSSTIEDSAVIPFVEDSTNKIIYYKEIKDDIVDGKESTSNKVTSMSASSSDTQYPSAKAVYSALSKKADSADIYNQAEIISLLADKEDTANKITSLTSEATDTQYPSAKAVYDYVVAALGDVSTVLDEINGEEV